MCLTYLWQVKAFKVFLHQEVVGLHVDSDEDLLALLSVGAVLLVHAQDTPSADVHRTAEVTPTWRACPMLTAGIHRTLDVVVVRNAA